MADTSNSQPTPSPSSSSIVTRATRGSSPGRQSAAVPALQLSVNAAKAKAKAAEAAITLQRDMDAAIAKLPKIEFPHNKEVAAKIQPDDLSDQMLMRICSALASVNNRALCPKEIAEVCRSRGWVCTGTQPFAIISTCIRSHLKRRGLGTLSDGLPAKVGAPPPLLTSFELHTTLDANETLAVGVDKDAKPTVKRGTLWFLSFAGTGFANPFGDSAPSESARMKQKAASEAKAAQKSNNARRASMPASTSADSAYYHRSADRAVDPVDTYDDAMGRGKRKRKASGIAGGDAAWHAAPLPSLGRPLDTVPESPTMRAGSVDSPGRPHSRRLKLRLGQNSNADDSTMTSLDDESQSDSDDEEPDAVHSRSLDSGTLAAIERRRYKKRSKSEGSLLQPSAMHHYHLSGSSTRAVNSLSTSPTDSLWGALRTEGGPFSKGAYYRGSSVDWVGSNSDVEMSDSQSPNKAAREDEEEDDLNEAMLNSDFDFQFDFASANRSKRDGRGSLLLEFGDDTPATSPESLASFKEEEIDYDVVAAGPSGVGADEVDFDASEGLSYNKETTLTEDCEDELNEVDEEEPSLSSPAPELPVLPLLSAAMSAGFAPAGLAPSDEDVKDGMMFDFAAESYRSDPNASFSRSLSPATSFNSSFSSASSAAASRAGSPAAWSDADSFDAEVIIGAPAVDLGEHLEADAPFGSTYPGIEDRFDSELPTALRIEELDLAWDEVDGYDHEDQSIEVAQPPPTPFGPEVFGFVTAPKVAWQPAPLVTCSDVHIELDHAFEPVTQSEDVDMIDIRPPKPKAEVPEVENKTAPSAPTSDGATSQEPPVVKVEPVSVPVTRSSAASSPVLSVKRNTFPAKPSASSPRATRATAQAKQEQRPVDAAVERRASLRNRKR